MPFEEHLFFVLQPLLLILLHGITTLSDMVPFNVARLPVTDTRETVVSTLTPESPEKDTPKRTQPSAYRTAQTLPRRPLAALGWALLAALGFLLLSPAPVDSALSALPLPSAWHAALASRAHRFYLGMILAWVCPVMGGLTWLGASTGRRGDRLAMAIGVGWLWMVDTCVGVPGLGVAAKRSSLRAGHAESQSIAGHGPSPSPPV